MLLAGNKSSIPDIDNMLIFNLSSLSEGYEPLRILPNINEVDYNNELEFDIYISNYILGNDIIFFEFFNKIIYPLYKGYRIYILVSRSDMFFESITESILKLIQQRYGYIGCIIDSPNDIDYINPDLMVFGYTGLYSLSNLDLDKERYSELLVSSNEKEYGL